MSRPDLLALDDEALVVLANRGLLKRATKALEKGEGPTLTDADGALVATFSDGTVTTLPPDVSLRDADCTCTASRVCRHKVAAVLAYRAGHGGDEAPEEDLPPCDVEDAEVEERIGASAVAAARRALRAGYTATVRLGARPSVLLPTCTVTFLAGWQLAHVRCDCRQGVDCEHVLLAVWALRAAPADAPESLVSVGGEKGGEGEGGEALEGLRSLQEELVRSGWSGAATGLAPRLAALRAGLDKARFVWLVDLADALVAAITEHEAASGTADGERVGRLLAEAHLRTAARPTELAPRGHLWGDGPSGATELDHLVLRGLGARYRVVGNTGHLEVYFREGANPDALVLERSYPVDDGHRPPTGPVVGRRQVARSTLAVLAGGTVTTRASRRRPNRVVEIRGRQLQTSITAGTGRELLTLAEASYEQARSRLAGRSPLAFSPRVRAWQIVVLRWGQVVAAGYDPGRRTVWGVLEDEDGGRVVLAAEWRPEAPGATAVLTEALAGAEVRFVTGEARLRDGQLWVEPLLVGFASGMRSLDFEPDAPLAELPVSAVPEPDEALAVLVESCRGWLFEAARRGLRLLTGGQLEAARALAEKLREAGLLELADALDGAAATGDRLDAWNRAVARVELLEHLLARG